jgi:hypothetical protein
MLAPRKILQLYLGNELADDVGFRDMKMVDKVLQFCA